MPDFRLCFHCWLSSQQSRALERIQARQTKRARSSAHSTGPQARKGVSPMRTQPDVSTAPAPAPGNIFTPEYLALLSPCDDEPVTATEAGIPVPSSDPWHLEPHPMEEGWAVLRQGTSVFSTQPQASFKQIDVARLAAAVIPSTERPPRFRLGQVPDALGY